MGRIWIVALVLASGSFGCGKPSTPNPILIGHVANLGEGRQSPGEQAVMGIDLALAEVNKDDKQAVIKVIHTDAQDQLDAYKAEATRLLTINQVMALLGGRTPDEVLGLDRARPSVVDRPNLFRPLLTPSGWRNPALSDQVFLVGMMAEEQSKVLTRFAIEELNLATMVILVDAKRDDHRVRAEEAQRAFVEVFKKKFPGSEPRPPAILGYGRDNRLLDLLPRLEREKPQAIFFAGSSADFKTLIARLTPPVPVLIYAGSDGTLFPDDLKPGEAVYLASAFAADAEDASLKEFVRAFRKANDTEPNVHASLAYASVKILANSLRRNPGFERLREELRHTKDFAGLAGPLSFSAQQQLRRPIFVLKMDAATQKMQKKY